MSDLCEEIVDLANGDGRFKPEAYFFVYHSLHFAQQDLGLGVSADEGLLGSEEDDDLDEEIVEAYAQRHITGQQLCEAIRQLALQQFGYLAKCVLNSWGVTKTGDFGEIVFRLIESKMMRKTDEDHREDFDDVFDFDTGLCRSFRIELPETV